MSIDTLTSAVRIGERNGHRGVGDAAYEAVLDLVLSRELRPGEVVQERRLAARLGISRTPLREALRRLEGERLLERRSDGSLAVRQITVVEFMEALHVRRVLESEAAAKAAGRIPADAIEDLRRRLQRLLDGGDPTVPDHMQTDADLHGMITAACGNQLMTDMIADLRRKTRMFSMKRMPERFEPICREHLAILDALARGDGREAAAQVTQHIENVKQSILQKIADF